MFGSTSGGGGGGRDNNESLTRLTQMMMMNAPPPPQPAMVVGGGAVAEDFSRRDDRVPSWSEQETRDFIAIRGELERDFTAAKRNKSLWEVVAGKMKEIGYRRTPDQCKCKWKNLVNRYKGKETSDRDTTRSPFLFFDEMHSLFTEKTTTNTPQTPFEPGPTSSHSKKRAIKTDSYQFLEEISEEDEDDEIKISKPVIPPRKKPEREKRAPAPKQPNSGNNSIREILHDFFQQQETIETQWRQLMEKHDYERRVFDQEWRKSMERLEMERMRIEQSWREKEEQRRMREESRAERRDALLTALLNKLINEQ